jgi:hypothetical protein
MSHPIMQGYADDDIKNAAELREWLTRLISEKQEEIDKMKITLTLIDSILKQGSFKTASNLNITKKPYAPEKASFDDHKSKVRRIEQQQQEQQEQQEQEQLNQSINENQMLERRQIKRMKDNTVIANVEITKDKIEIIPLESINFNIETPPFKSFFINRILEGMKNKDLEKVNQGSLEQNDIISFTLNNKENKENILKSIEIKNYKDKERINEIFNTVAWVFTRMLEKSER